MKTSRGSSQPEIVRTRIRAAFSHKKALQAHASSEPPRLENLEFFPHTMILDGIPGMASDEPSPTVVNSSSPATRTSMLSDTPTRIALPNGTHLSSPLAPESDGLHSPSALSSQPGTPTNETVPGWSAAVGRASLGKSGRVIEKLMGENDMHRRDKALAKLQRDEEVKQHESTKSKYEALRVSHDNLQVIHQSDNAAISRKDRKIEELRAEIELERTLRKKAEDETKVARRERDEDVEKYKKEAMYEQEQCRGATNSYEVLKSSFKGLDQQYKRQTQKLRSDFKAIEVLAAKEQATVAHLTIISDQAEKEAARQRITNEDLQAQFDAYKSNNEELLRKIRQKAESNQVSTSEALEEVRILTGQMRHTINVARDVREPM